MFKDTITIYHHTVENNADKYSRAVVDGFYLYDTKVMSINEKGVETADNTQIISTPQNAKTFGKTWNVKTGDKVVKGVGTEITSVKQLTNYITVTNVSVNVCGSEVDNIVIEGK